MAPPRPPKPNPVRLPTIPRFLLALPIPVADTEVAVIIKIDPNKKVKRVARKVVGSVPAAKVIQPKSERKKPKYKSQPELDY